MNGNSKDNFSYLNVEGLWPGFRWRGLELREDGALQLYSLPLLEGELPKELATLEPPEGPAGIAVCSDGTIYFSDPAGHCVLKIYGCDGAIVPVACIGGKGGSPVRFDTPRGLLIPHHRRSLLVADSANHRIQIFDLDSMQLVAIWGQEKVAGEPQPGSETGRFNTPWALGGDCDGNIYVVDYGNKRVQKFNRAGDPVASFRKTMKNEGAPAKPADIAVLSREGMVRLYIVDEASHSVFVFDGEGRAARDSSGAPARFGSEQLQKPMGIAVTEDAIYVGDNARRRVLKFNNGGGYEFVGEAVGYSGPIADLALDNQGGLLVHSGTGMRPVRLAVGKGYQTRGVLWSGAIEARNFKVKWHRLKAEAEGISNGARLRLFVHTSNDKTKGPSVNPGASDPFADPNWRPLSGVPDQFSNVSDLFIGGDPAQFLWVGALFSGEGRETPVLSQLRAEFDHETYLAHLPAIYRDDARCGDSLIRFLSLFETFFGEVESRIEDLSVLFDPAAVPKEFLGWLASWFALEMDEDWDEEKQRQAIASAFEMYGRRGTAEGLRESLRILGGVNAIIEEPILNAAWWSLPAEDTSCKCNETGSITDERSWAETGNSVLGFTTMPAPAHAQGAVLGSTATLDQSHLITDEEFGSPLFEDVAHQFSVQIYRGQLKCAETLSQLRSVIEREKPAHTDYHLCIIEPRMRVGYQARVGIDTVVAGPPRAMGLGEAAISGEDLTLGGEPTGRAGVESRVGITTRVG